MWVLCVCVLDCLCLKVTASLFDPDGKTDSRISYSAGEPNSQQTLSIGLSCSPLHLFLFFSLSVRRP